MKRVIGLFTLLVLTTAAATAQVTIKGRVIGSDDGKPITGAYVIINASEPDAAKRTSLTDFDGNFQVVSREKNTNVTITFIGYQNYYRVVGEAKQTVDLGTIRLSPEAQVTQAVTVTAKAPMAVVKGDTLQYNAAAFKTNPDASSEDLLKKMPGVTTNDDGAVEVHGETLGKVYVDGKEFFADDPAVALKTLPADVIASIQVFDDKSDESKFSGFDDGERIKAINIVTQNGVSNSVFGKAYAGYGTDNRYSAGVAANIFNADQRWTVLASSNNVNNQGFTLNDIAGAMTGRRGGMGGGIDASQFTTNVRGGIQTTTMAGLNYQGDFEKVKISGSYFFNNVNANIWQIVGREYQSQDLLQNDTTRSQGYNYQHRANLRIEWNPNETNRIFFTPRITYSTNHGNSSSMSLSLLNGMPNTSGNNRYATQLGTYDASANLFWMHRFEKAGRTLSIGGSGGGTNGWGGRTQESVYGSISDDESLNQSVAQTIGLTYNELNQIGILDAPGYDLSGRISYSEPLSKSSRLQFSYRFSYDQSDSKKLSYNLTDELASLDAIRDLITELGLDPDPTTSNLFNRDQTRHVGTIGYNWVKQKKMNLNASISYQYSTLNDDETYPRMLTSQYNFDAWLPRVRFEFNPSQMEHLNIEYRRTTSTPTVNQLQDLYDISDPLNVSVGNPNLKQSYTDRIDIRYNRANPEKSNYFHLFGRVNFIQNYISTHRRFLTEDMVVDGTTIVKGAQLSSPVNLNGYISANLFSMYGFSINPIRSNLNIGLMYMYTRTPSIEDNIEYRTNSNRVNLNLSLTSNISEAVDFTVAYRPGITFTTGRDQQTQSRTFDRYIRSDLSAFLNLYLWKGLFINLDATWRNSFGTQASYSQHYALLNAGIGYKFLKYRQAEVRISGYDLLNQNRAFRQSTQSSYIQTTLSNVLQRYFMVSFTYKFDTRKGRNADNYGTEDRPAGPMGGGPRPGGGRGPR